MAPTLTGALLGVKTPRRANSVGSEETAELVPVSTNQAVGVGPGKPCTPAALRSALHIPASSGCRGVPHEESRKSVHVDQRLLSDSTVLYPRAQKGRRASRKQEAGHLWLDLSEVHEEEKSGADRDGAAATPHPDQPTRTAPPTGPKQTLRNQNNTQSLNALKPEN